METNGYGILRTTRFKKSFKLVKKRGYNISLFEKVVEDICSDIPLPPKYENHVLSGKYKGISDLHIKPDWVLLYLKDEKSKTLTLFDTGTHSDLLLDSVRNKDSFLAGLAKLHDSLKRKTRM